jgi:hypothetical protein
MPVVRTDYAPGAEIPDCIQRDLSSTIAFPVYRDDMVVAVTQAGSSFSLRKPDGSLLISGRAVTVVGGVPQVSISSSEIASEPFQMGYRGEWTLVISGSTYNYRNEIGIVRYAPILPISDRNLTGRHSKIDTWLAGTGKSSWQTWIDLTWAECQRWLVQKGNRANLIVQSSDLVDLMRVWTMRNILTDILSSQNGERFRDLFEEYKRQCSELQSTLTFAYAHTDDVIPDSQRRAATPVTFLGTTGLLDQWNRGMGYDPDPWMP